MLPVEEYQARLTRLRDTIKEQQIDAFLVTNKESIYYLTGVSYEPLERPFFLLAHPQGAYTLLVPTLEREHLRAAPYVESLQTYWDYPSLPGQGWPERLLELVQGIADLGVEPTLSHAILQHLQPGTYRALPLIEQLRLVKSAQEIQLIRYAARYADSAVAHIIGASYYGVAEIELFGLAGQVRAQMMGEVGYDALTSSVMAATWPAPGSEQPHYVPKIGDQLKEGPHIAFCLDKVFGYAAECERTYFTAAPTQEVRATFATMSEARRIVYTLIKPGVRCAEIDAATMTFLRQEGYGENLLHRTGHGFGLGNHEGPWVAEGSSDVLAANMVISNEPGIYIPGIGGIRHSDTILVTETGYENLTHYPSDLESLIIRAAKPFARLRGRRVRRAVGLQ